MSGTLRERCSVVTSQSLDVYAGVVVSSCLRPAFTGGTEYCHTDGLSWWRHQMETFSALLALCAGKSPVPGEFHAQSPMTRSFDVFFGLHLKKRLSKPSWCWRFETTSCSLWRQCNVWRHQSWRGWQRGSLMYVEHMQCYYWATHSSKFLCGTSDTVICMYARMLVWLHSKCIFVWTHVGQWTSTHKVYVCVCML